MSNTSHHDERIAKMVFGSIYPHYLSRIEKNGRTEQELMEVIEWLTGHDNKRVRQFIQEKSTFEDFFNEAQIHPNASLIKGMICGYRVEEIENSLTRNVRYFDKLVDELARGRKMDKILRTA